MTDQQWRDLLADAIRDTVGIRATDVDALAGVLMPVLEAAREDAAAQTLDQVADHLHKRAGYAVERAQDYAAAALYNAEDHLRKNARDLRARRPYETWQQQTADIERMARNAGTDPGRC